MQHTYGQWGRYKERSDAKKAFLDPLAGDERLTIITEARVDRILVENGRAVGVAYTKDGADARRSRAEREVLVGAGTYNSAKLMMLSGIGPADHLREHGIAVVADLAGVGAEPAGPPRSPGDRHHQGHRPAISARTRAGTMLRNGLQYLLFNSGPVTTTGIEACLFFDPDGGERPTIQLYCAPIVYLDRDVSAAKPTWGVTFTSCLLRPKARGTVTAALGRSGGPAAGRLQFLRRSRRSAPHHRRARHGARSCSTTEPFRARSPRNCCPALRCMDDPTALERYCGQTVKTNYHPVGHAAHGRRQRPDGRGRTATSRCAASRACG